MVGKLIFITLIGGSILFFLNQTGGDPEQVEPITTSIDQQPGMFSHQQATAPLTPLPEPKQSWFIIDETSQWNPAELEMVDRLMDHTFQALELTGLDGQTIFAGYRFRRVAGEHIEQFPGLIALVNHQERIISLADAAFVRLDGFYIYHELGHVVDQQLGRSLSRGFHSRIDSAAEMSGTTNDWQTATGYWMRAQAREDREEATADAFALWVGTEQALMRRPIFAGTPLSTDYEGLMTNLADSLVELSNS